jgi:hypothetical protein
MTRSAVVGTNPEALFPVALTPPVDAQQARNFRHERVATTFRQRGYGKWHQKSHG